jgi:Fe-S cluster assembly protein SufD
VPAFDPQAVRALAAPDHDVRAQAAERAAAMSLPTVGEEVWRYSRIGELDLDAYRPGVATTTVEGADGFGEAVAGADAVDVGDVHDLFDELNAAFNQTVVLTIPKGTVVPAPIIVTHTVGDDGVAVFPRLVVDVGENSEVTIVERFRSADGLTSLVVPRLYLRARQAARVSYLAVQQLGTSTWQLGNQYAVGDRDSTTQLATVALGGDYARVRTDAVVAGQGATTKQIALYFADGTQMHDFRTKQDHAAPKTNSELLFKGAVQDHARSVYTGLIHIRKEAKGSVAFQTNRNLTLSEGAWAESVPNLEIETNDVKCSHASTVGPIDDEQRFYLESRGIPPEIAERLVVLGFFDEVLGQLPVGAMAGGLRSQVEAKLQRRLTVSS